MPVFRPPNLEIVYRPLVELKASKNNARTHSRRQITEIVASIREFGFTNPILTTADGTILAGHGRMAAAKLLGMVTVPTIVIDNLSPAQQRALMLADNKIAANAGWDLTILAEELEFLLTEDLSFDSTGFSISEVEQIIGIEAGAKNADPRGDALPELGAEPTSTLGDVWVMAGHRLLCGNALQQSSYVTLMLGQQARMVFSDPPYNVPIAGHVSGLGRIKHTDFAMAVGEMSEDEFTTFLTKAFCLAAEHSVLGSIHYQCMDWRHLSELLSAGKAAYTEVKNICVWTKDNGGMGTFYRSQHEMVGVFKSGTGPHVNNFELGQHGRYRTNVWPYKGANSFGTDRTENLALHPTVKPVAMIADAIRDVTKLNDIVLDPFGGSGSTLIAAEQTRRQARLIELDPVYVDRTVLRWQTYAKDVAVLEQTGETFEQVEERRAQVRDKPDGPASTVAPKDNANV